MELSGSYFNYDGVTSRLYDLVFANVDTSRNLAMSGQIDSMTIFNKSNRRSYFIGESADDSALTFEAEIVVADDKPIDYETQREITKWLFRQQDYRKLYVDNYCDSAGETFDMVDGEEKRTYLNCRFTNPSKIESGSGVIGFKFDIECDCGFAWQEPVISTFVFDETSPSTGVIEVDVDTDALDYVNPVVRITTGKTGGDISIINLTDNPTRTTKFVGLGANVQFVMKSDGVNYVSGDNYMKFVDRNFVRLLDGINRISITGDVAKIEFEFQNKRFL